MKIYIETLGCPKNFNDSQVAAGVLEESGHQVVETIEESQGIMINTCGFINDAKMESIERIFDMSKEGKKLIVSGCLTQRYGETLFSEMPEIDLFIGVNEYYRLPELLHKMEEEKRIYQVSPYKNIGRELPRKMEENPYTATIKISEGCDHHCTYCIIPSIRGKFRSRPMEAIIEEARRLSFLGTKEIILIAQDTTSYGIDIYGEFSLDKLLKRLCQIEEIKWIRLMYCYEDRITDKLIKVISQEEKVCKYIDIPIQHSSDKILKRMGRRSSRNSMVETLKKLRREVPDIHIRTTLIVGFPGEEEEDFEDLLAFIEEIKFQRLGVFTYSREENTPAYAMKHQIDEGIKEGRKNDIMLRQLEISLQSNQEKIGKEMLTLVEGEEEKGIYYGRTQYDAPEIDNQVLFKAHSSHKPGDMVMVKINDGYDYDLIGEEL